MKETKTTIKGKAAETGVLPEFINGNTIFNDFLGVNIYIIENESNKKTINTASMNWQSTYALQHLEEVVQKACGDENLPIYVEFVPTRNTSNTVSTKSKQKKKANRIKQVPFNRDHIRNWLFQTAKLQQTF